jgi:hypothetical protein
MAATNTADIVVDEKLHGPDHIEKTQQTVAIDNIQVLGLSSEDAEFYTSYPPEARKKLLWKVRPIPPTCYEAVTNKLPRLTSV